MIECQHDSWGRLNVKVLSCILYRDSHYKDEAASKSSYLYNGNSNTWTDHLYIETGLCGKRLHDDVIKWKHFPRYWPFVRGIHRGPVNSPHKGQWRGALMFSLICVRINGWVNNREVGDLRRHHAHYDVIVMAKVYWEIATSWVPSGNIFNATLSRYIWLQLNVYGEYILGCIHFSSIQLDSSEYI